MQTNDLISRSALIERYGEPCHSFLDIIESMPTVDAVEVVRCNMCAHYETEIVGYCHRYCRGMRSDDYCSRGVKR